LKIRGRLGKADKDGLTAILLALTVSGVRADTLHLYAAGSLKAALGDVAAAYEAATGQHIEATFGPSGLMRERIEKGEPAHVFASADMDHPRALESQGKGGPVRLLARNRLCAIAQPGLDVSEQTLLEVMSRPEIRLGTSTPKSDPAGDYAWKLFDKAETVQPGSRSLLAAKALQLTGGPTSAKPPAGRNPYAWVMASDRADLFLTYCTNAVLAQREVPGLQIVRIPPELAVGADYGLTVVVGAPPAAGVLADFILGEEGQTILTGYGFEPAAAHAR